MSNSWYTHDRLGSRYRFIGTLLLESALHIGSGRAFARTDAPVIRGANGEPFIPGSSLKGTLRSAVERIAPNIPDIRSCRLIEEGDTPCLTVTREWQEQYQRIIEQCDLAGRTGRSYSAIPDNAGQWLLAHQICTEAELKNRAFIRDLLYRFVERGLCDTCRLFGSTSFASRLRVHDLYLAEKWIEMTEIRDGVGIDRDTETARPKVKFDLEVVPSQTNFAFCLDAENLGERDLGLLCVGLQEFRAGVAPLGGRSTRGLGQCRLILIQVHETDLSNVDKLLKYLTASENTERMMIHDTGEAIDAFLRDHIRTLFETRNSDRAEDATE